MEQLRIKTEAMGDTAAVIRPDGHINALTAESFENALKAASKDHPSLVLDMSAVAYMASPGFGAVLGLLEPLRERGGDILFAGMDGSVKEAFKLLGLGSVINTHDSVESALDALGSGSGQPG